MKGHALFSKIYKNQNKREYIENILKKRFPEPMSQLDKIP